MGIDISIIIVSYNVKDFLLKSLQSIFNPLNDKINYEVIVIDNNSTDDSIKCIRKYFPKTILIGNSYNAGFPKANNQGFAIAKGKYIFMLNPDAELTRDALSMLFEYMENHLDIALVAPKLLNTDDSFQQSVWRYPTILNVFSEMYYMYFFLREKNYHEKDFDKFFEAESFSGAALFFRYELLKIVGVLDENLFWIEDIDFCYRVKKSGFKLMYFPDAQVRHHVGKSAKKNYRVSLSNQIFNKIKFFKKHYTIFDYISIIAISFFHVALKLIFFLFLSPINITYWRKAKAYLYTLPRIFNPPKGIRL